MALARKHKVATLSGTGLLPLQRLDFLKQYRSKSDSFIKHLLSGLVLRLLSDVLLVKLIGQRLLHLRVLKRVGEHIASAQECIAKHAFSHILSKASLVPGRERTFIQELS